MSQEPVWKWLADAVLSVAQNDRQNDLPKGVCVDVLPQRSPYLPARFLPKHRIDQNLSFDAKNLLNHLETKKPLESDI